MVASEILLGKRRRRDPYGESTVGFCLTSLVGVDVAIGWSEVRVVRGKGKERVSGAAEHIRKKVPYRIRDIHTDNGGEFIALRLYANFFQPLRKLTSKERIGAKVRKHFDEARTPYERLPETGILDQRGRAEVGPAL